LPGPGRIGENPGGALFREISGIVFFQNGRSKLDQSAPFARMANRADKPHCGATAVYCSTVP